MLSRVKMYQFYTKQQNNKLCSMYAAKHQRHDLFNLYDMQNDADDITTNNIENRSELRIGLTSDDTLFWQISSYVNNKATIIYKEYINCA